MLPEGWWTTFVFTALWAVIGIALLMLRQARRRRREARRPAPPPRRDSRPSLEELERRYGRKG